MKDFIFVANHKGAILFMNSEGETFNDFNNDKMPYSSLYDLFTTSGKKEIKEKIKAAKDSKLTSIEPIAVELNLRDVCITANLKLELSYCQHGDLAIIAGYINCIDTNDGSVEYYKQLYLGFIDNLPLGIYRTGASGTIHYASKKFVDILGFDSDEELYKSNVEDFFVEKELRTKMLRQWTDNKMQSVELQVYKKNGEIIWVKDSGCVIRNEEDEIVFLDGILEDITAQKENELKLKDSEFKLKELNASKDLLFSIISHDLRTPFNQFIGATELLLTKLEEYDKNMLRKFLTLLNKEAVRSYRLLENLLQWSKTQRGLITFDPKPLDLFKFVSELMLIFEPMAEEKSIDLEFGIPKNLHAYADKEMLSTILRNLISNALKFTPKGGSVKINAVEKVDEKNIFSEYLEISVVDTGIGIPKSSLPSLFIIQKNSATDYNESSTGLGLVLCKDFVERHNGKIWAESEYGKGSTFYFTIR